MVVAHSLRGCGPLWWGRHDGGKVRQLVRGRLAFSSLVVIYSRTPNPWKGATYIHYCGCVLLLVIYLCCAFSPQ